MSVRWQWRRQALAKLLGISADYIVRIDIARYKLGSIVYEVLTENEINKLPISMSHYVKVETKIGKFAVRELSQKLIKKYAIQV